MDYNDMTDDELRDVERHCRTEAAAFTAKADKCFAIRVGRSAADGLRAARRAQERARTGVCCCDAGFGMNLSCPVHQMGGKAAL